MNTEEQFLDWLSENVAPSRLSDYYLAMEKVKIYADQKGIIRGSLYDVTDSSISDQIVQELSSDWGYKFTHRSKWKDILEAAKMFHSYTEKKEQHKTAIQSTPQETASRTQHNDVWKAQEKVIAEEKTSVVAGRFNLEWESEFQQWLERINGKSIADGLFSEMRLVDEYAQRHRFTQKSLFLMEDYQTVKSVRNQLEVDPDFERYNQQRGNRPHDVLRKYDLFRLNNAKNLKNHDATATATATAQRKNVSETEESSHANAPEMQGSNLPNAPETQNGKHPCQLEFENWMEECGTPARSIKTYSNAVKRLGDYLLRSGKEDRHLFSIFGAARLNGIHEMLQSDSDYASKYGREDIFFDMHALGKYIAYRRNDRSGEMDPDAFERYSAVLREHFSDGFRIESIIDRDRFKQFYEVAYGERLAEDDAGMVEKIRQIGGIRDGRVYARSGDNQNDLLDDIQADIAKTFQEGARRIYLQCVFEKYQAELAERLQIYSEDTLQEVLLNTSYGAYQCKEHYFYIKGRKTDFAPTVQGILVESHVPISVGELKERLWYLPEDQIKHSLPKENGFVNIGVDTYFYAPNAPINEEELQKISALLRGKLSQRACISEEELQGMLRTECPSVAINMEEFSPRGLKNVLCYRLKDQITAKGSLIYEIGHEVSSNKALVAFCESHESMKLEELDEFMKDMNMTLASEWDTVYDMMVRISSDEFVRRGRLQFDIKKTDEALDRLIEGDYMPIKQFSLYMHLPAISEQWNEFVLESYLLQYSKEFTIHQQGHYRDDCCGAIARRSSGFDDIKSIITDALVRDNGWKTEPEATGFLIHKGYLQRKCKLVGECVEKARRIKADNAMAV